MASFPFGDMEVSELTSVLCDALSAGCTVVGALTIVE